MGGADHAAGGVDRVEVEGIFGIRIQGKSLHIDPCTPHA